MVEIMRAVELIAAYFYIFSVLIWPIFVAYYVERDANV